MKMLQHIMISNRYNTFKMIKCASYDIRDSIKNQVRGDMFLSAE